MFIFERELFAFLGFHDSRNRYYKQFFYYGKYCGNAKFHYFSKTTPAKNQPV